MFGYNWKKLLFIALASLLVGACIGALVSHFAGKKITLAIIGKSNVTLTDNPNGSYTLMVPKTSIPQTDEARSAAAPLALLPTHWEGLAKSAAPGAEDQVFVPADTRAKITSAAAAFLGHWETFRASTNAYYRSWQAQLRPYIGGGSNTITERSESFAPETICPHPVCTVGSLWFAGYPYEGSFTIRAYSEDQVYLTGYGFVRYSDPAGNLNGKIAFREYALLLTKDYSGRWLVTRAIASSIR